MKSFFQAFFGCLFGFAVACVAFAAFVSNIDKIPFMKKQTAEAMEAAAYDEMMRASAEDAAQEETPAQETPVQETQAGLNASYAAAPVQNNSQELAVAPDASAANDAAVPAATQAPAAAVPAQEGSAVQTSVNTASTEGTSSVKSVSETYQKVFDDYASQLHVAALRGADELKTEAAANKDGELGISVIRKNKIAKLAAVEFEGNKKLAEIYHTAKIGTEEDYQQWTNDLYNVYLQESRLIDEMEVGTE